VVGVGGVAERINDQQIQSLEQRDRRRCRSDNR
jgi:hypothetical protein